MVDRESLTNNDCTPPASMWGLGEADKLAEGVLWMRNDASSTLLHPRCYRFCGMVVVVLPCSISFEAPSYGWSFFLATIFVVFHQEKEEEKYMPRHWQSLINCS